MTKPEKMSAQIKDLNQPGHPASLFRVDSCSLRMDSEDCGQTEEMLRLIWVFS